MPGESLSCRWCKSSYKGLRKDAPIQFSRGVEGDAALHRSGNREFPSYRYRVCMGTPPLKESVPSLIMMVHGTGIRRSWHSNYSSNSFTSRNSFWRVSDFLTPFLKISHMTELSVQYVIRQCLTLVPPNLASFCKFCWYMCISF